MNIHENAANGSELEAIKAISNAGMRYVKLRSKGKAPAGEHRIETVDAVVAAGWRTEGFNVGLVPGEGVTVVDIDPRNAGDEAFKKLVADHGTPPKSWASVTGGGGYHLYLKWRPEWGKPRGTLGPGIDIKHGENVHVVAPGSTHPTGNPYAWAAGFSPADLPMAEAPAWIRDMLAKSTAAVPLDGAGGEITASLGSNIERLPPPPESPEIVEQVQSMLKLIDPDLEYPAWRDVGWALKSTGWACAEDLFIEWSRGGGKFDEDAARVVLSGFKTDGGIGFGTLVHMARQAGWADPRRQAKDARATACEEHGDVLNGRAFARLWRNKLVFVASVGKWLKWVEE